METERPYCCVLGCNNLAKKRISKKGEPYYRKKCDKHINNPKQRKLSQKKYNTNLSSEIKKKRYRKNRNIGKQRYKRLHQQPCWICGWHDATCDLHRIFPGEHGGTYKSENILILCPNCHRLAHKKQVLFKDKLIQSVLEGFLSADHVLNIGNNLLKLSTHKNNLSVIFDFMKLFLYSPPGIYD